MKKCSICRKENPNNASVCVSCGSSLNKKTNSNRSYYSSNNKNSSFSYTGLLAIIFTVGFAIYLLRVVVQLVSSASYPKLLGISLPFHFIGIAVYFIFLAMLFELKSVVESNKN